MTQQQQDCQQRIAKIMEIAQPTLDSLVDAIDRVMANHPEPYRTLAEALILSRGEGAVKSMADAIHFAVDCDLGEDIGR